MVCPGLPPHDVLLDAGLHFWPLRRGTSGHVHRTGQSQIYIAKIAQFERGINGDLEKTWA